MKYAFIALHRLQFSVRTMCRLLRIHPSGFYTWLKNPLSTRASEDKRQTDLLLKAWEESGKVYGYRKLHDDLLDQRDMCCPNRIASLTRLAGIKAQIGNKRRPGIYGGKPAVAIDNSPDRQFDVAAQDTTWVTDITYIRTCEGFAYLAVVIDLYSPRVIGWAMQSRQTTDVVLQALLMAVWRRKPKEKNATICGGTGGAYIGDVEVNRPRREAAADGGVTLADNWMPIGKSYSIFAGQLSSGQAALMDSDNCLE